MRFVSLALAALFCLPAFASEDPVQAIERFHGALHSGDKDQALALLSSEVVIYESGHVERTRSEYAGHHLMDDIAFSQTTTRRVLKQSIQRDGQTAIVTAETETRGQFKGKEVHSLGLETTVLSLQNGQWAITHIHWSSRKAK